MANVRNFGATGDGNTDDTEAIRHAVVEGDGGLEFPRGDYRITGTIEIPLDQLGRTSIHGTLGVAKIIHAGPGPAFKFVGTHTGTASPLSVESNVWANQRTPTVAHIEIEGRHAQADGITCDHTMQAIFDGVTVRNCRHGIHLIRRNRNVIVANCHLYHNRGAGLFLDGVNLHQINVVGCHISYNALGGIRVTESEIRNLQITGCDLEYNNVRTHGHLDAEPTAEIYIDTTADGSSVTECTIASNTIQATPTPGGANIRMLGSLEQRHPPGLTAITGNMIGNQENTIHLTGCRSITITGNIIYSSEQYNVLVERSRQIIVSANVSRRHTPNLGMGYRFVDSSECVIVDNHLDDESEAGQQSGICPLELNNCERMNITGCQIAGGVPYGIDLQDCSRTTIANCQVFDPRDPPASTASIRWRGSGRANRIANNTLTPGSEDALLLDDAARVRTDDNLIDE